MWLELLIAYIKKVHRAILIAATYALFIFGIFPHLSAVILGVVYLMNCMLLFILILRALGFQNTHAAFSYFVVAHTLIKFMPDAILLLSATPYIQSLLTITLFLQSFHALIPLKYSLFHLLVSPSARADLINELIPISYEGLAMNPEELDALRSRQKTAISKLPEALKQLHSTQKDDPNSGNPYTHYRTSLQENQRNALDHYLEIKSKISKGKCMITLEEVNNPDNNLYDFVILEKHYYQDNNYYAVPGAIDIFLIKTHEPGGTEQQSGLKPLFDSKNHENSVRHPANRDSFKSPPVYSKSVQGPSYPCRYVHHPYEIIDDHPLALALCESIEAFNASLQPSVALARERLFTQTSSNSLTLEDSQTLPQQQPLNA